MHKQMIIVLMTMAMAGPALAANKQQGTTMLKDFQPAGVADKHAKHSKRQVYDLTFDTAAHEYVCRTSGDKSTNATDFVVGSTISYEIDGQKVKIKTPENKSLDCRIVRVSVPTAPGQ